MDELLGTLVFIVLYGGTYGVVLFIISIGLVMTMGLMRVPNMAHGAFAALGGYATTSIIASWGLNHYAAIALATLAVAALGCLLERTVYARIYHLPELDQLLVTLGMCFVAIGLLALLYGPNAVSLPPPRALARQVDLAGRDFPLYRLALLGTGAVIIGAFWLVFERTDFGARLRAAVDNRSMAQASGINVNRIVMLAFCIGTGLAAFGGAAGASLFPLEPLYALKYLPLILFIVALSGFGNIKSSVAVAIVVGMVDTAGRYFFQDIGGFVIYALVILTMVLRPSGMFARRGAE
jgi:branched-chain amino acid transport system permease protein